MLVKVSLTRAEFPLTPDNNVDTEVERWRVKRDKRWFILCVIYFLIPVVLLTDGE